MKRRLSILGVVAVMATSLWAAAPAQAEAAERTHCQILLQGPNVVEFGPGTVTIYPANAGPYVGYVLAEAQAYADCLVDELAGPVIDCLFTVIANRPTVMVDPNTPSITIDYSALLGTTCEL